MEKTDLHVHTVYSDGKDTPEQIVLAALSLGMETVGFSDHAHTAFDESYCIPLEKVGAYRAEIARLKEKYRGKIRILCGIEQDYYADTSTDGYDYVIGSVHYLRCGDEYIPVDEDPQRLRDAVGRYFGGDPYRLVETYYETVADVVCKTGAAIVGHFDLITKFIEKDPLFDVCHPRYRAAWQAAADRLLAAGVPFEINTGAISRGYRTTAYPAPEIRDYLRAHGGKLLLSSDAHSAENLCFCFEAAKRGEV